MARINILDKQTINRIAAGEVIERPASVVKELMENAIDAGATSVTCEISGGGIELIRITDNGSGIEKDDVRVAFQRHTTSKIRVAEDLFEVRSLGFRGEALASIAAVSKVELITKTRNDISGIRYIIEDGEEKLYQEIGCPEGTTFIIRDLFAYVPVRKKFLKSAVTEASYVTETVEKIALSHPEVSVKYINNKKTVLFTNGSNSIKNIIYSLYGKEIASELLEVSYNENGIKVGGYIAKPIVARGNRALEIYSVNGRYIRNNAIGKAIEDAYSSYLMQHKYPFTAMNIELPSETMDVNVHPTKQEVRFENPSLVYDVVYHAVDNTLRQRSFIPKALDADKENTKALPEKVSPVMVEKPKVYASVETTGAVEETGTVGENGAVGETGAVSKIEAVKEKEADKESEAVFVYEESVKSIDNKDASTVVEKTAFEKNVSIPEPFEVNRKEIVFSQLKFNMDSKDVSAISPETKEEFKKGLNEGYKIVGQVFNTYWIVERGAEMYIIDQHAAHEKVIYERLINEYSESVHDRQILSPAIILSLSASECIVVDEYGRQLEEAGFVIEHFGGREYSLREVPLQLYGLDPASVAMELIDSFISGNSNKSDVMESFKERIATAACKAAVKGNNRLSENEAKKLVEELLELDNPFNCPHGRPVIISMTSVELEKRFKRIVN